VLVVFPPDPTLQIPMVGLLQLLGVFSVKIGWIKLAKFCWVKLNNRVVIGTSSMARHGVVGEIQWFVDLCLRYVKDI
jgi:hypothetical protein